MPSSRGLGLNLLQYISGQELGDLGEASKTTPGLLDPDPLPPLSGGDKLARRLNSAAGYFANVFGNVPLQRSVALQNAQWDQEAQQAQESSVIRKLLPALGTAAAARAEQVRTDAQRKQQEIESMRRERLGNHVTENYVMVDEATGKTRGLTPEEQAAAIGGFSQFFDNPNAGMPDLPPGMRKLSPEEKAKSEEGGREAARNAPENVAAEVRRSGSMAYAGEAGRQAARNTPQAIDGEARRQTALSAVKEKDRLAKAHERLASGGGKDKLRDFFDWKRTQARSIPGQQGKIDPPFEQQIAYLTKELKGWMDRGFPAAEKAKMEAYKGARDGLVETAKTSTADLLKNFLSDMGGGAE